MLHRWEDTEDHLLDLLHGEVHAGLPPVPTLVAFAGDDPVAVTELRPFPPGGLLDAVIEVLALLLPLGTDRLALAVAGRAWSLDDPVPPVSDEVDLRQPVVVVTVVDAHRADPPRVDGSLHPYGRDDDGHPRWLPPRRAGAPEGRVTEALVALLAGRRVLADRDDDPQVLVQLSRCVLRGHQVALAPEVADRLERASARPVG